MACGALARGGACLTAWPPCCVLLQDVNVAANEVEEADDDAFSDTELDGEPGACAATTGAVGAAPSDATGATVGELSGPAVQLLISACWTSYKEASLLIGTLAARLPLPKSTAVGSLKPGTQDSSLQAGSEANGVPGSQQRQQQQLIECQQLEQLGSLQLSMLLSMKHNGAVEKSLAGFIALLERLLESPEAGLNQLPRHWLGQCLDRVQQQGQSRDDIVRRSAGRAVCGGGRSAWGPSEPCPSPCSAVLQQAATPFLCARLHHACPTELSLSIVAVLGVLGVCVCVMQACPLPSAPSSWLSQLVCPGSCCRMA